jgi:hypothetical protein
VVYRVSRQGTFTAPSAGVKQVDVTGQAYVHLAVLPTVDGINYDHADWANATVTCS